MICIRTLVHPIRKITARISSMGDTVPHQCRDLLKRLLEGGQSRCFIAVGITVAVNWLSSSLVPARLRMVSRQFKVTEPLIYKRLHL
jgi:hypothetical protein